MIIDIEEDTMLVIGIIGKQNAGKDAMADYLCQEHGFKKLSTGDIKRIGWPMSYHSRLPRQP